MNDGAKFSFGDALFIDRINTFSKLFFGQNDLAVVLGFSFTKIIMGFIIYSLCDFVAICDDSSSKNLRTRPSDIVAGHIRRF